LNFFAAFEPSKKFSKATKNLISFQRDQQVD